MEQEKDLSEKESLELITQMINKAKNSYYETGMSAIMWGAVIAICSLVRLAERQFGFELPFDIYLLTLAAVIPQIILSIRGKKQKRVKSYDDVALDYIWLGFGICIFLLIHVNNQVAKGIYAVTSAYEATGATVGFQYYDYMHSFFLILYGLPTFITGGMCRFMPMFWGGILCWICSVVCVYTEIRIDLILTAVSAIFAWLIPGIIMEKEYRLYKKQTVLDV